MRRYLPWVAVLVAIAAIAGGAWFYFTLPPLPARLLPQADAILYMDLRPVRLATSLEALKISHDAEYEEFIRRTGFQAERDLDQAAIAVHPAEGSTSGGHPERRFSQVLVGRYDAAKLNHYLHKLASGVEKHAGADVFTIPHDGRTVRVILLDAKTVAISNTSDARNLHAIIQNYRALWPRYGSPLLRASYSQVPVGSSAWAIADLQSPNGKSASLPLPGGVDFALPAGTITVASARALPAPELRIQALTPDENAAQKLMESASTFLSLFRAVEANIGTQGSDPDVKRLLENMSVEQDGRKVVLRVDVPPGFVKKIFADATAPDIPAKSATQPKQK